MIYYYMYIYSFRTTLCLQYSQHHMALGAIFLALLGSKAIPNTKLSKSWVQIIIEMSNLHDNKHSLREESLRGIV